MTENMILNGIIKEYFQKIKSELPSLKNMDVDYINGNGIYFGINEDFLTYDDGKLGVFINDAGANSVLCYSPICKEDMSSDFLYKIYQDILKGLLKIVCSLENKSQVKCVKNIKGEKILFY